MTSENLSVFDRPELDANPYKDLSEIAKKAVHSAAKLDTVYGVSFIKYTFLENIWSMRYKIRAPDHEKRFFANGK